MKVIDISRFMETVRSRWNFEENEFDAIEKVVSDVDCLAAIMETCLTCCGDGYINKHANLPDEPCPDCKDRRV